MTSSELQLPACMPGTRVMTCTIPLAISTFLSRPSGTPKARYLLSADQNGCHPFSVPGSARSASVSRDRSHNTGVPPGVDATNARYLPSGDSASDAADSLNVAFGGGFTGKVKGGGSGVTAVQARYPSHAARPTIGTSAATHVPYERAPRRRATADMRGHGAPPPPRRSRQSAAGCQPSLCDLA